MTPPSYFLNRLRVEVLPSSIAGLGCFAVDAIDSGAIVLSIDDSRVVAPTAPLDPARGELERNCDYLADGKVVLMRSPERHINHSCDPNTFVLTLGDRRRVVARRDIAAGDEVTYDYCVNGFGDAVWPCRCGAQRCRHTIHADFFHLPPELQREYLPLLDEWFVRWKANQLAALRAQVTEGGETGLRRRTVALLPHDPEWRDAGRARCRAVLDACGQLLAGVEHVGSTAVPGLPAKPIVDLAARLAHDAAIDAVIPHAEALGYIYRGDGADQGGHLFVLEREPDVRVVHLHVVRWDDPQWPRYLAFRDGLRRRPDLCARYAVLKLALAATYRDSRKAYTESKHDFIGGLLAGALAPVAFRPLVAADIPLLHHWLSGGEAARWYGRSDGEKALAAKYCGPAGGTTDHYIVSLQGKSIGFLQTYRLADHPDYARAVAAETGDWGLDLFIGDDELIGRGIGTEIVRAGLRELVFPHPDARRCIVGSGPGQPARDPVL